MENSSRVSMLFQHCAKKQRKRLIFLQTQLCQGRIFTESSAQVYVNSLHCEWSLHRESQYGLKQSQKMSRRCQKFTYVLKDRYINTKGVFLGRINNKGNAREAEPECHMWVDELIGGKPDKVSVLCGYSKKSCQLICQLKQI